MWLIQLTLYLFTDTVLFLKFKNQIHMNTISKNQNRFGVFFNMLPNEILVGFKTINCTVKCEDENFRPFYGLEIGFLFFTVQITYVDWKV